MPRLDRVTTFAALLSDLLRHEPGRPLLTYYDERPGDGPDQHPGERVELSVTTYANWVAKVSSLLVEEHDLERGQVLRVDLPAHWLTPVLLGAAWNVGLAVDLTGDGPADAVVCGPAGLERWAVHADEVPVLACSLRPMGVRFADPLPAGVHDVGVDVWSQPDSFVAWDPAQDDDAALVGSGAPVTQGELWRAAAAGSALPDGGRLLSVTNPASPPGIVTFTEPLARRGSLVLVVGGAEERLAAVAAAERTSTRHPARS